MASTSFTIRIDAELKSELGRIARSEKRSTSFMANQAIKNLGEGRKATQELVEAGLALVVQGAPSLPAEDMHAWMLCEDESEPFPSGRASILTPT